MSIVNLDEEHERALNLVLNNQEAQGRYDPTKLLDVLDGLQELRDLTGFDDAALRALRLSPMDELPAEESDERIELTLVIDPAQFDAVSSMLDELVREFGLVTHVRRT